MGQSRICRIFNPLQSLVQRPTPAAGLLPSVAADAHQSNGANGVTASGNIYLLSEGRVGSTGQVVNQTINGRTTPWIWTVIKFNALGFLNASDSPTFPAYYVYKNGQLIQTFSQGTLKSFVKHDETYQRLPGEIQ